MTNTAVIKSFESNWDVCLKVIILESISTMFVYVCAYIIYICFLGSNGLIFAESLYTYKNWMNREKWCLVWMECVDTPYHIDVTHHTGWLTQWRFYFSLYSSRVGSVYCICYVNHTRCVVCKYRCDFIIFTTLSRVYHMLPTIAVDRMCFPLWWWEPIWCERIKLH